VMAAMMISAQAVIQLVKTVFFIQEMVMRLPANAEQAAGRVNVIMMAK